MTKQLFESVVYFSFLLIFYSVCVIAVNSLWITTAASKKEFDCNINYTDTAILELYLCQKSLFLEISQFDSYLIQD